MIGIDHVSHIVIRYVFFAGDLECDTELRCHSLYNSLLALADDLLLALDVACLAQTLQFRNEFLVTVSCEVKAQKLGY